MDDIFLEKRGSFLTQNLSLQICLAKFWAKPRGREREREIFYFKSDTGCIHMCIVFYRVFKSDLWSYMVNTDLLPATPSSWVLSCVVFLLGGNQQIEQIVLILLYWGN